MMNRTKIRNIALLVLGSVVTIALIGLFRSRQQTELRASPAEIKKAKELASAPYRLQVDALSKERQRLAVDVTNSKTALQEARNKNLLLERRLRLVMAATKSAPLSACDTVEIAVEELMSDNATKDSICNIVIAGFDGQVAIQDSLIGVQQEQYRTLEWHFDRSLEQQRVVAEQHNKCGRQRKRQTVLTKILSAGLLVLSATTAYGIFSH